MLLTFYFLIIYKPNQLYNLVTKMVNLKDEIKRQSATIKEGTDNILDQQRQQIENTTSNISDNK